MTVPKAIHTIVAELGLRYRPTSTADLDAHRARLALLAEDLADAPPAMLRAAATEHARASRWMPTAAELVERMQTALDREPVATDDRSDHERADAFAAFRNAGLKRDDIEWHVDSDGAPRLRFKRDAEQELWRRDRILPSDVPRVNWGLKVGGHRLRWTPDGFPYDVESGEPDPAPETWPPPKNKGAR